MSRCLLAEFTAWFRFGSRLRFLFTDRLRFSFGLRLSYSIDLDGEPLVITVV